jgi:hypothetical protein
MSVKKALNKYFKELLDYWNRKYGTLPKTSWDEDVNPLLFQAEPDEEEYIYWKPKLKDRHEDFDKIEKMIGITINSTVKEYFDSYWFLEIEGFYNSKRINLEPNEPDKDIVRYFQNMKQYEKNIGNLFRYIQIGVISPEDMSIAVDNETGKIVIQDYETGNVEVMAESLEELIEGLRLIK